MSESLLKKYEEEKIFDGRYKLEEMLSSSSKCTVYRALDTEDQTRVVLKIFNFEEHNQDIVIEAVKREALSLFSLDHQNILKLKDCIHTDGSCYLVLEDVEGEDLRLILSTKRKPFSTTTALDIVLQILSALKEIHSAGIIHRNIKPENIILSKNSEIKICGFSASHYECVLDQESVIPTHGTFDYLAPEIFEDGVYSRSTDIYAVMVLFYNLVTRRLPFNADLISRQISLKKSADFTSLVDILPSPPVGLNDYFKKGLASDPAKRYLTTTELAFDLQDYLENIYRENRFAKKEAIVVPELVEEIEAEEVDHSVDVEVFVSDEVMTKPRYKKAAFYASIAVSALVLTICTKTILDRTNTAEAVSKLEPIIEETQDKTAQEQAAALEISKKESLILDLENQIVEIRKLESKLASSPSVIYNTQASSIPRSELEKLDEEKLEVLVNLRAKRIELLSKKLSNVLKSAPTI